jgi:hypothetical protein
MDHIRDTNQRKAGHRILAGREVSKSCLRSTSLIYSASAWMSQLREAATSGTGLEGKVCDVHRYCNGDRGASGCPRGCV